MSKRLQVLFEEEELREIQRLARRQRMTVAEWVRQTLRQARRSAPRGDAGKRLQVVRAAAQHSFPTAEIDEMLRQIERGYLDATPR
ncbi:MAG TPA: antitoxin [Thermoanaerobaculia bacterium]|nr:antitoxin [Thermoanaerobaculia bacterium]